MHDLRARHESYEGKDPFAARMLGDAELMEECLSRTQFGGGFLQPYTLPDHAKDWRWLIDVLPADIDKAFRPNNPNFPTGRSKTGPLAKILEQIIPHISGDKVTAVGVSEQLSEHERKQANVIS